MSWPMGPHAVLAALALVCAACSPGSPGPHRDETIAAHIGGAPITVAELDERIKQQLFERASQGGDPARVYELRSEALGALIEDRLLEQAASERGVTREELLDQELGTIAVEPAEVQAFYSQNEARMGGNTLEQVEPEIRRFLAERARGEAQRQYVAGLRAEAQVRLALEPPRVAIEAIGPSRGPENAPVTIIEFSDYACPYCKNAEPVVRQVLERYPEEVRYVYRHYPLESLHPLAFRAAEAASCAGEQDRFWQYHDRLFEKAPAHEPEALKAYARELGLDGERFDACLDEGRTRERVRADLQAGEGAGVRGTPAFFVNGLKLSGSRPLEEFVVLIDAELAAAGESDGGS